ncbi:MAG: hypothetical protein AAF960_24500 [Bacteroidota bacterium]
MPSTKRKGTYNLAQMRPIVAAYATHRGTKKAYCAQHDLPVHTFDYWRKRVAAVDSAAQSKGVEPKQQSSFIQLPPMSAACLSPASPAYTLHFPDGKRLDLPLPTSIDTLTHLLQITL